MVEFQIDFNRRKDSTSENYKILKEIPGIFIKEVDLGKYQGLQDLTFIKIWDLYELKLLEDELELKFKKTSPSIVIGFNPPTIYLDFDI